MTRDDIIATLTNLGLPVFLQGSAPETYPASFYTFWCPDSETTSNYDNAPRNVEWTYTVNYYSDDASTVDAAIKAAQDALRAAGWRCGGGGYDVQCDVKTHTGRAFDAQFDERSH